MRNGEPGSNLHSLELHLRPRLRNYRKHKLIEGNELERVLMSTNKSIIYIKMPSHKALPSPSVSSPPLPLVSQHPQKQIYSQYEEQRIRQTIREKHTKQVASNRLPQTRYPSLDSPHDERVIVRNQHRSLEVDRLSVFAVDGSKLGYQNLKQKYLELRQVSLPSKKRSQLMEGRGQREDQTDQYAQFFKIQKNMMEQMSRGQPKEFLRTRVNGYRTIFHPTYKQPHSHSQHAPQEKETFSNFVRRKKGSPLSINPEQFQLKRKKDSRQPSHMGGQCSPWETDAPVFD